jgi:hypothetical protein
MVRSPTIDILRAGGDERPSTAVTGQPWQPSARTTVEHENDYVGASHVDRSVVITNGDTDRAV